MLNAVIRFSLRHRLLIVAVSLFLVAYGGWELTGLPIDVLPDLNRPRVTVMTEAPGMAPEEVEALITFPLETAMNGATGVQAVHSESGVGLSVVRVEFDWGSDIYDDRQIVAERLALVAEGLPPDIKPQLAPISSIMGQIMMIGIWSENPKTTPMKLRTWADWEVRRRLLTVPGVSQIFTMGGERKQFQVLVNPELLVARGVTLHEVHEALKQCNANVTGGYLDDQGPREMLVRSLGRVESLKDLQKLCVKAAGDQPILLDQVARVVEDAQVKRGDSSVFVRRADGRFAGGPAVVLTVNKQPGADTRQVTDQIVAALEELKPSAPEGVCVNAELYQQKTFIDLAIANVVEALCDGSLLVVIVLFLFLLNFRTTFITLTAIPLSLIVTILVFSWFGLSINAMTLGGLAVAMGELVDDAIVGVENIYRRLRQNRLADDPKPALSIVFTASLEIRNSIVFATLIVVLAFIPPFALGGMEGQLFKPLAVAYIVSILSSLLVSLTLTPVLSYWVLACRRIWPAMVAVMAPALALLFSYWLVPELLVAFGLETAGFWLRRAPMPTHLAIAVAAAPVIWGIVLWVDRFSEPEQEGLLLRTLKAAAGWAIAASVRVPALVLGTALVAVVASFLVLVRLERDFLPPFDEGSSQLNIVLPPGTSLAESKKIAEKVHGELKRIDGLKTFLSKTGRAELDEHAVGVHFTEIVATFPPDRSRSREDALDEIDHAMSDVPGIAFSVEQPLAHLISAMLSGVQAQVAVKIFGDNLEVLRAKAKEMEALIQDVPGVRNLMIESQANVPQLQIRLLRDRLAEYGLTPGYVNEFVETAMHGSTVSQVLVGQRTFDLTLRLDEPFREDLHALERLSLELPGGGATSLGSVATIEKGLGPNTIKREAAQRRIALTCRVAGRGLVDVVEDIQEAVRPVEEEMARDYDGYFVEFGGQFQSQQSAFWTMLALLAVSLVGVFLVLYTMFGSANFAIQVMASILMALIGAVAALVITGQTFTIAAFVGFISLAGIASRNGILLLNHYLYLVRNEGESFSAEMLVRAGQERVAPVLMTALTSSIGLVPLALAAGEPGKEILYPIATVIIGGLATSTLLEFLVRPALFWTVGRGAGRRLLAAEAAEAELDTGR